MYVRVRIELAQASNAVLLPQQAVNHGVSGDTVMVVDAEGRAVPRPVKLGSTQGSQWVVLEGLKAGENVMVDGFQKLRPNIQVKPVPWSVPAASAPAAR
jgi:membrane fusion protein (multidrug efflux system)